jgi:hypothetical protein
MREQVLERDRFRCRACGTRRRLLVHHRTRSNAPKVLVTLCIRCHSRIHRSLGVRHWLSGLLLKLWCELHQHEPMQMQFAFTLTAKNERSQRSFGQRIEVLASFSLRNVSRELRVAEGICAVPVAWEAGGGKLL